MHPLLQAKLAADQIHLFALCLGEVVGAPKPCAGILHRRIEHALKKIVADIIMTFAHNRGTTAALKIEKKRRYKGERRMKIQRNPLFEPRRIARQHISSRASQSHQPSM